MKNNILTIMFLLFTMSIFGQDRMYVTAKSGLIVRDKPSLESNKIFHLPNNTMTLILKKTGISLVVTDEGKEIKGEWLKIHGFDNGGNIGYVFGGFLTTEKPEIWYSGKKAYYKTYSYYNQQEGTFESSSISEKYLNKNLPAIQPNIDTLNPKKFPYFFNPQNREIVLFKNHKLNNLKPVGILKSLTQVRIDSTFYKLKYKDLTNCVWNRININGKYYYTDLDIHDFSLSRELINLNQKVEIIGQYDGYDGVYHLAYPEYFFLIFTDNKNKVIHKTKVLEFYLNDEFAMDEDILGLHWNGKTSKIKKL
ncbi:SH3 domain-containing protein [Tamlana sp. 2201CG12-4]|uniref:SH3 domain-containing protein n=1 Tax=Tamlana sp. 2201CG12-4 TaxID=3112582 RepID=UPI002DB5CC53|nr:SH3 domain-containing protein [Tamlana sp. 2201CG12-4]MEC3905738.1 SH3 domain-containing protein [Tamlana sp. 2201CG12-4]